MPPAGRPAHQDDCLRRQRLGEHLGQFEVLGHLERGLDPFAPSSVWPPKNRNRPSCAASEARSASGSSWASSSNDGFIRSRPSSIRPRSHITSARRAATRPPHVSHQSPRRARSRARSTLWPLRRGRRYRNGAGPLVELRLHERVVAETPPHARTRVAPPRSLRATRPARQRGRASHVPGRESPARRAHLGPTRAHRRGVGRPRRRSRPPHSRAA